MISISLPNNFINMKSLLIVPIFQSQNRIEHNEVIETIFKIYRKKITVNMT